MKINNNFPNIVLILISLLFIGIFYYVSLSRIGYPFELEWMEGGSVDHLERIINGQPIYTPPSVEFIPYIYTPLYYYAAIPLTWIFGISVLPLRIVSLISTTLIFAFLFLFVKRETRDMLFGFVSCGLFAAIFSLAGAWFDLARVDMLFILLLLISFYILRCYSNKTGFLIAALFASLSFLTKQTASLVFFPILIYLFIYNRKLSWYFIVPFLSIVFGSTVYYSLLSDGWYYFWNFTLPADHRWTQKVFILFWTYDLIRPLSILLLLTIVYFYLSRNLEESKFYIFFLGGAVLESWLSRLHYGGYANVLIPVYLSIIILSMNGLSKLLEHIKTLENNRSLSIFICIIIIFQFATLIYSPGKQIPSDEDKKAGWELVYLLKQQKGDVYVIGNTYFARLAGKKTFAHGLLIWDLMQSSTRYNRDIEQRFNSYLNDKKFDLIIDYAGMNYPYLDSVYENSGKAFKKDNLGWTITGYTTRPNSLYYPKK